MKLIISILFFGMTFVLWCMLKMSSISEETEENMKKKRYLIFYLFN